MTSLYVRLFLASAVIAVAARLTLDNGHRLVFQEDGIIELLSAALFLCAFLIALAHSLRNRRPDAIAGWVAALGIVAFLEEVSYLIRWIGDGRMFRLLDQPFDGVHDLLTIAIIELRSNFEKLQLIAAGAATAVLLIVLCLRRRETLAAALKSAWGKESSRFLLIAAALIAAALLLDAPIVDYGPLYLAEECLEMQAGLALVFASVCLRSDENSGGRAL